MSEPKIMKYFQYSHLPLHLQKVSEPFCVLAEICVRDYPNDDPEEKATVLRKLLEAKDAAVRCCVK